MRSFVLAVMLSMVGAWAAEDGSRANPLTVESVEDLEDLRLAVVAGTKYKGVQIKNMGEGMFFKQTADIDLSSVCGPNKGNWKAIGPFSGSYDGGGHKISNLFADEDVNSIMASALFGPVMPDSKDTIYFENIVIDKAYIHSSETTGAIITQVVSGVVVMRNNTVDLEYKSGSEDYASGAQVGGLVGNVVSGWTGFYNNTVKGSFQVTTADGMYVGGLIGTLVADGNFTGNTNEAKFIVKGVNSVTVGGLAGQNLSSTVMKDNTNKGNIQVETLKGYTFVGGLIGVSTVKGSPNTYVGNVNYGKIEVTGSDASLGGLFGLIQGDSTMVLDSCINQADVIYRRTLSQEIAYIGGIAGLWEAVEGTRLQNFGNIIVENAIKPYVGGLIGYVREGSEFTTLKQSVNRGKITIKKENVDGLIAGLIGVTDSISFVTLDSCTNMGDIEIDGTAASSLVLNPLVASVPAAVTVNKSTSKNWGNVPGYEKDPGAPSDGPGDGPSDGPGDGPGDITSVPAIAKALDVHVVQVGEGRITLEIPGMESMGRVRAQLFSYDGKRVPVSMGASGSLLYLNGVPSAGKFLVRVATQRGNRSIPVTLR